jgi:hypothetical protein
VTLPPRIAWEPVFLPLFFGISLLSAVPPGSLLEQAIMASAAGSPLTVPMLRLALGLAVRPRPAPALSTAAAWLRGAFAP